MLNSLLAIMGILIVGIGYYFVIFEEKYHLKKSITMIFTATALWVLIGIAGPLSAEALEKSFAHEFLGFCEIFFFITVAMSYVLTLEDFGFFHTLHGIFASKTLSSQKLYWMTGLAAFFLSPFLDNLTTALLMGQILLSFAPKEDRLIEIGLIHLVIAANAGGVFSPFGDLTSLMIWQKGYVPTLAFGYLFIPSFLSYLIPAGILSFYLPRTDIPTTDPGQLGEGCGVIAGLFAATILFTLGSEHFLGFPAVFGMLLGLSLIAFYERLRTPQSLETNLFTRLHRIDWDTLLFFYGIMLSIEGLKVLGVLSALSYGLYVTIPSLCGLSSSASMCGMGHTLIGLLSALIDNIPMMAAVLKMNLEIPLGSWLLLTLTTGIGGSLLAIGSAAGIALMGLSRKHYNFSSHLRWTPVILLGYAIGIWSHVFLNAALF